MGKHDDFIKITYFIFKIHEASIKLFFVKLQLHGAIYSPDSFVMMLRYCENLKAIRYESTSLNRIVGDKSHRVIVALNSYAEDLAVQRAICTSAF